MTLFKLSLRNHPNHPNYPPKKGESPDLTVNKATKNEYAIPTQDSLEGDIRWENQLAEEKQQDQFTKRKTDIDAIQDEGSRSSEAKKLEQEKQRYNSERDELSKHIAKLKEGSERPQWIFDTPAS